MTTIAKRSIESLANSLTKAYDKIEKQTAFMQKLLKDWDAERTIFVNRISTLTLELEELRNRRD